MRKIVLMVMLAAIVCCSLSPVNANAVNLFDNLEVGSYITFGSYEQDDNAANGTEPIKWRILAKDNNDILVISEYVLSYSAYNSRHGAVTWETCELREWLNNSFYNMAFNDAEKAAILEVTVTADNNPRYDTNPGNDTQDRVFLLSVQEAKQYFSSDEDRMCHPVASAVNPWVPGVDEYCSWWLRTPGMDNKRATIVIDEGSFTRSLDNLHNGSDVWSNNEGVRPAMWIKTN